MINLIIQFYKVKYENANDELINKRQQEINYCFVNNLNNPVIDKIHFLYEMIDDVDYMASLGINKNHEKIILYSLGKRMNYKDIFGYANEKHNEGDIWIYVHGDMCIESGFEKLKTIDFNKNNIYALTAHKYGCNKTLNCNCTRQYHTEKGLMSSSFDGFVFKSPLKIEAVNQCDHIVHRLGAENRTIAILKNNGYNVTCPNAILRCHHVHYIKIFANQHATWVEMDGTCRPQEYYSNIHRLQKQKPYHEKIVGGGIPFYLGCAKLVNYL